MVPRRDQAPRLSHTKKRYGRSRNERSCHCRTSPDRPSGARNAGLLRARHLIWIDYTQHVLRWNVQQWPAPLQIREKKPCQQKRNTLEQTHAANLSLGLVLRSGRIGIFQVAEQQMRKIFARTVESLIYHMLCSFSKNKTIKTQKPKRIEGLQVRGSSGPPAGNPGALLHNMPAGTGTHKQGPARRGGSWR